MIRVIEPGLQTTIQDFGRTACRHLGVARGGAADWRSLAIANRVLGNPAGAAGLEIAMHGPVLEAEAPLHFAWAGCRAKVQINDRPVPAQISAKLAPGDGIRVGPLSAGARIYAAFSGGLSGHVFLGSQSTDLIAGAGGYDGRPLAAGDCLIANRQADSVTPVPADDPVLNSLIYTPSDHSILRVLPGPDFPSPADTSHMTLLGWMQKSIFLVSRETDRRGARLSVPEKIGQKAFPGPGEIRSGPVFPGTVQLPPGGTPIILGVDGQTTGGYPRILHVAAIDHALIGQLYPGQKVSFLMISTEDAARAQAQRRQLWQAILALGERLPPGFA